MSSTRSDFAAHSRVVCNVPYSIDLEARLGTDGQGNIAWLRANHLRATVGMRWQLECACNISGGGCMRVRQDGRPGQAASLPRVFVVHELVVQTSATGQWYGAMVPYQWYYHGLQLF